MNYRRSRTPGAIYFFTLTLADRTCSLLTERVNLLREVMREVKDRHPFEIEAIVILPEHLHTLWRLPENDVDYTTRWMLIKSGFSRRLPKLEMIQHTRLKKRERGIWQRRYWEHFIRDETDWQRHVDYIHYNPVKHGLVERTVDWPYSSFHRYVKLGWLGPDWGHVDRMDESDIQYGE